MKFSLFIFLLFSLGLNAQSNKFLSLDIEHLSTTKRIKYYEQDKIIFKVKNDKHKYKGIMVSVNDSFFVLDSTRTFRIKDVQKILVDNSNHLTRAATTFISGCGAGYIIIDAFNNIINLDSPIFNIRTLEIGAGLIIVGQVIRILSIKRYKINKNHRLKFIDDTP
jgi:hypothetical protein